MKSNRISPNYTAEKLDPPFFRDMVDIFEDRIRYWILKPAKKLLEDRNDHVASVLIMINYIEGIQIYLSGEDSKGRSFDFFKNCFMQIFKINTETSTFKQVDSDDFSYMIKAIYNQVRCGFAHDGMFRFKVLFDDRLNHVFLLTADRENESKKLIRGEKEGTISSIIINPKKFYKGIELHFEAYVRDLKQMKNKDIVDNFKKAMRLKSSNDDLVIGVSADEYETKYVKTD